MLIPQKPAKIALKAIFFLSYQMVRPSPVTPTRISPEFRNSVADHFPTIVYASGYGMITSPMIFCILLEFPLKNAFSKNELLSNFCKFILLNFAHMRGIEKFNMISGNISPVLGHLYPQLHPSINVILLALQLQSLLSRYFFTWCAAICCYRAIEMYQALRKYDSDTKKI